MKTDTKTIRDKDGLPPKSEGLKSETHKATTLALVHNPDCDPDILVARTIMGPHFPSTTVMSEFAKHKFGDHLSLMAMLRVFEEQSVKVQQNDLSGVEATLVSQATALNAVFSDLARRSALNMGSYLDASEKYMRMALKAQNQCRMTLETLANIKNPPVVYARQANVTTGPQQVTNTVNNTHAHATENQNAPKQNFGAIT